MTVEFEVVETNSELPGLIAPGLAAWAAFYSWGGMSRAQRFRDPGVIAHFRRLLAKKNRLEAAGQPVPLALSNEIGVGMAHGVFANGVYRTDLDKMLGEEDDDGNTSKKKKSKEEAQGGDCVDDMAAAAAEIDKVLLKSLQQEQNTLDMELQQAGGVAGRPEVARAAGDKYLGPLLTPHQWQRLEALNERRSHCSEPKRPYTPREYVRKLERRKRRAGKEKWERVQRDVQQRQDQGLRTLIPEGTSAVFASRLNYHSFAKHLSHRINAIFMVLALCNFWDRMYTYCVNRGIALIEICEGYTTKQCARRKCGKRTNVGASETFKCWKCKYERSRDIKVSCFARLCVIL